jgi:hypothetical protein
MKVSPFCIKICASLSLKIALAAGFHSFHLLYLYKAPSTF